MVIDSNIIALQNPWWEGSSKINADPHILEISGKSYRYTPSLLSTITFNKGDIHVIRGPRQVGKTTTLKLIIKRLLGEVKNPDSIIYLSCESLESFQEMERVLIECLKDARQDHIYLFLDEISFVHLWQRAILALSNMGMLKNVTVILTGSNARDLKESSERLPGRRGKGKDYKLYPLSIIELANIDCFSNKSPEEILEIYMSVGGFPRAISDYVSYGSVTDTTYETYRNWVIGDAERYKLRQETLKQILYRIAVTISSRVTWPVLIENSPVKSHETALQYVEHLQDAFLCRINYCYDPKAEGAAFGKARKIYFIDPLLFVIARTWRDGIPNGHGWMKQRLNDSGFKGNLFESVVINHLARLYDQTYYWYSTKVKKEVDLLIKNQKQLSLYEVKLGSFKPFKAMGNEVEILTPKTFLEFIFEKEKIGG